MLVDKILAKLLANRLAKVVASVISKNQSAFVNNKQILDNILILNESIDYVKRGKEKGLVFKVDFEKAYDSVLWEYLDEMMRNMNFHWKWRKWIRGCLSSATMAVLVNGCPSGEFQIQKGFRKRDPLSNFLFLIAAEGLSCLMRKAVSTGAFEGFEIGKDKILVSHLQFADDTVLLGKASVKNAKAMKAFSASSK